VLSSFRPILFLLLSRLFCASSIFPRLGLRFFFSPLYFLSPFYRPRATVIFHRRPDLCQARSHLPPSLLFRLSSYILLTFKTRSILIGGFSAHPREYDPGFFPAIAFLVPDATTLVVFLPLWGFPVAFRYLPYFFFFSDRAFPFRSLFFLF